MGRTNTQETKVSKVWGNRCNWQHYFGWGFSPGKVRDTTGFCLRGQRAGLGSSLSLSGPEKEIVLLLLWEEFFPTVEFSTFTASPTVSEALLVRPAIKLGPYGSPDLTRKDPHHLSQGRAWDSKP